jgi:hypothetical protein
VVDFDVSAGSSTTFFEKKDLVTAVTNLDKNGKN